MINKVPTYVLSVILFIGLIMFFFSGPGYHSARSFKTLWDLGHIFFYTILTIILLRKWKRFSTLNIFSQFLLGILITLLTGIPIELLQIEYSRIPEFGDIWRNLLGCFVGISFFSPKMEKLPQGWKRFFKILVIILVMVEITAPVKNIIDETIARRQFPLLSGFETPFETGRWTADNGISRTKSPVYIGKYAAEILLTTEKYSRVSLEYFPRDWHQYEKLMFSIFNTKNMNLQLSLRIHDGQHLQSNEPYDRYAKSIILTPGWNVIEIPLQELENAPRDRKMDLGNIYNFMIYSSFLSDSTWIYLDEVRLR